jgi:anti-sigma B factor antagonist
VIVDLSRVEFLASAGIGVLVGIHNNADGMAYAVVADGPATSRPLKILGIDTMFQVYPRVAEAISGLGLAADDAAGE